MDERLVVALDEGGMTMADRLGGKGANLAEMTLLGLPVPPGFVVTTDACREYLRHGRRPERLDDEIRAALGHLEARSGAAFGAGGPVPLLVSVRSGARFSMPGMMDTVLDVGLTDAVLPRLVERSGPRFAWDCYRRLVEMYASTVWDVPASVLAAPRGSVLEEYGASAVTDLPAQGLEALVGAYQEALHAVGRELPQDPWDQLVEAVDAVFRSWNSARAVAYRAHAGIPDDLGTAVTVMQMVYGNSGPRSGSGVCFTRDPVTGAAGPYGDYLGDAQGEDVVSGRRRTVPVARLAEVEPAVHHELVGHLATLEKHYRDLCDVEFTVDGGRLWLLQTRVGQRSPAAAFVIACDLVDEGLIGLDEALARVDGHQLDHLLHATLDIPDGTRPMLTGLPASPGAAVGTVVFTSEAATRQRAEGVDTVLVRPETNAEDLEGMLAAVAVVTARGGLASHAAVVARGLGRPCVAGSRSLVVDDVHGRATTVEGDELVEGDLVSVDGSTGAVYRGGLPLLPSPVAQALFGPATEESERSARQDPLVLATRRLLEHADRRARTGVRVNAETVDEAAAARRAGASGIGLCRTEHMLLGERSTLVERVVLDIDAPAALAEIERLAEATFAGLLRTMDGLPVVVRLLDPPLHEFLPPLGELTADVAALEASGRQVPPEMRVRLAAVARWSEVNPMLGLRGVRLLTVHPELVAAHARALVRAARTVAAEGMTVRPELMVPLVSDPAELQVALRRIRAEIDAETDVPGAPVPEVALGVMVETPRAALLAGPLAEHASFFSFGTNDLTQMTWGMSRDDAQASFLEAYRTMGILVVDPFARIDEPGVGELVRLAIERGRAARPDLEIGVCGEHGGDPESVHFFARCGVDYVSCSAPRVPVARLEAGRAAVLAAQVVASDSR